MRGVIITSTPLSLCVCVCGTVTPKGMNQFQYVQLTVSSNPTDNHAYWDRANAEAKLLGHFYVTYWLGRWLFNYLVIDLAKCGGTPSCKYHMRTSSPRGTSTSSSSSNTMFKNSKYYAAIPAHTFMGNRRWNRSAWRACGFSSDQMWVLWLLKTAWRENPALSVFVNRM